MCVAATPFTNKACQLANQDLQAQRKEYVFTFPKSILTEFTTSGLRDSRDLPLALLLLNITLTAVPAAVLLHVCSVESHAIGLTYLVLNYVLYLQVRHAWYLNTAPATVTSRSPTCHTVTAWLQHSSMASLESAMRLAAS